MKIPASKFKIWLNPKPAEKYGFNQAHSNTKPNFKGTLQGQNVSKLEIEAPKTVIYGLENDCLHLQKGKF